MPWYRRTFAELEHDSKKRRIRRELFLERMDGLVPWAALEALVEPFHPKPGRGKRLYPLRTMMRVHCVHLSYDLSDPGMEDLLYEVSRVAGLRLSGSLPDETTILKFGIWGTRRRFTATRSTMASTSGRRIGTRTSTYITSGHLM